MDFCIDDFYPVDTHFCSHGLLVVGKFCPISRTPSVNIPPTSLREAFSRLPSSIQTKCGDIHFPNDDGKAIMDRVATNNTLFGASDASFKKGRASHAWLLSSGNVNDITDDDLHISGQGPVDGYSLDMSSGSGEIHGITAMSIMFKLLLQFHCLQLKWRLSVIIKVLSPSALLPNFIILKIIVT